MAYGTLASRNMGNSFSSTSGGGYSDEVGLALVFYKELQRYTKYHSGSKIPTFDGGIITEVVGKGKYKVKLQLAGGVVTAISGEPEWSTSSTYVKGAYALILIQEKQYLILAVRQTGAFRPSTVKYPV